MDIKRVASQALNRATLLLSDWLPGGKLIGKEWTCGDLSGSAGDSCKVNIDTGKWCDFATGDKGGDLVSLYAKIHNIKQSDAATRVAELIGYTNGKAMTDKPYPTPETKRPSVIAPPKGTKLPNMLNKTHGEPEAVYKYTDAGGQVLFLVARYANKQFTPFTYTSDGKWQRKAYPSPRPLFGLSELKKFVLIVEGEKTAIAARKFASSKYCVVTWPNGSNSTDKTDWSPLYNRDILIWPDHDEPGRKAAASIASQLLTHCPTVKIISTVNDDLPDGWDAADSDFTWETFLKWAKPRAKQVSVPIKPAPTNISDTDAPPMPTEPYSNTNILIAGDDVVESMTTNISPNNAANVQRCGLQTSKQGFPTENLLNVSRILEVDFSGKFWFDDFYRSFMTSVSGTPEPLHDSHILDIQALFQASYGLRKISKGLILDGITAASYRDRRNSAKDYFLSLKWDGCARMDDFFINACGSADTDVNRHISRYFFSSIIARIFGPELDLLYGNKVDSMLVIEGDQGLAKGMLLKIIASKPWHFEVSRGSKDKDFFQDMRGKLIGEVAELAAFDGQNLDTIKRVITCQTDRLRVSYGKESQDFDRTAILVGTTNKDEYLQDDTGNRRFLPIHVTKVDLQYAIKHREQVLAEALEYYRNNVKDWWYIPKDLLADAHSKRMVQTVSDDMTLIVKQYLDKYVVAQTVSVADIWINCFKQDIAKLTQKNRTDISRALRNAGYENRTEWDKVANKTIRVWAKPIDTTSQIAIKANKHIVKNYAPSMDEFM